MQKLIIGVFLSIIFLSACTKGDTSNCLGLDKTSQNCETQLMCLTEEKQKEYESYKFSKTLSGKHSCAVAYSFFKACIQGDIEEATRLLNNPDDSEFLSKFFGEEKGTMDDVTWFALNFFDYDPLTERAGIIFEFGYLPEDSLYYFEVELVLKDNEWKVVTFCVQK